MQQDSKCLVFNILKMLAVVFANFLIIKSFYYILSSPSAISKIEYAYMLLGFIMLFGATFASSHEFCDSEKQETIIDNKSDKEIIKEEFKRRDTLKSMRDELNKGAKK